MNNNNKKKKKWKGENVGNRKRNGAEDPKRVQVFKTLAICKMQQFFFALNRKQKIICFGMLCVPNIQYIVVVAAVTVVGCPRCMHLFGSRLCFISWMCHETSPPVPYACARACRKPNGNGITNVVSCVESLSLSSRSANIRCVVHFSHVNSTVVMGWTAGVIAVVNKNENNENVEHINFYILSE